MKLKDAIAKCAAQYLDNHMKDVMDPDLNTLVVTFKQVDDDKLFVRSNIVGKPTLALLVSSVLTSMLSYWMDAGSSQEDFVAFVTQYLKVQPSPKETVFH